MCTSSLSLRLTEGPRREGGGGDPLPSARPSYTQLGSCLDYAHPVPGRARARAPGIPLLPRLSCHRGVVRVAWSGLPGGAGHAHQPALHVHVLVGAWAGEPFLHYEPLPRVLLPGLTLARATPGLPTPEGEVGRVPDHPYYDDRHIYLFVLSIHRDDCRRAYGPLCADRPNQTHGGTGA